MKLSITSTLMMVLFVLCPAIMIAHGHKQFYSLEKTTSTGISVITIADQDNLFLTQKYNTVEDLSVYGFDVEMNVRLSENNHIDLDGNIFKLKTAIRSNTAKGFTLKFKHAAVGKKMNIKVYDNLGNLLFSSKQKPSDKEILITDILWSKDIILEYSSEDRNILVDAEPTLAAVTYIFDRPAIYDNFFAPAPLAYPCVLTIDGVCINNDARSSAQTALDDALSCDDDINCVTTPNQYCRETRATVMLAITKVWNESYVNTDCNYRMIVSAFTTGVLVNNVRNDMTPYILTAGHVVDPTLATSGPTCALHCAECGDITVSQGPVFPSTWMVLYNYQRPTCDNSLAGNSGLSTTGIEILYYNNGSHTNVPPSCSSDIALLKVTDNPYTAYDIPVAYDIYYAGIDRNAISLSTPLHFLSHPLGDVKKFFEGIDSTGGCSSIGFNIFINAASGGGMQFGISGSPIFDANHKVKGIATVSCGLFNTCISTPKTVVAGGRNFTSCVWGKLQPYLDPDNTGATSIDGYDPLASCLDDVDVYGTLYPAATWRAQNQMVIHAADHIQAPPTNLTCLITESPTYAGFTKQPYQTDADYIFRAGTQVRLAPGFKVLEGNRFRAQIAACSTYTGCVSAGGYSKTGTGYIKANGEVIESTITDTRFSANGITLFPNPATETAYIRFENSSTEDQEYQINITGMNGNSVWKTKLSVKAGGTDEITLSLTDIPSGVYTCNVEGNTSTRLKLVVVKR